MTGPVRINKESKPKTGRWGRPPGYPHEEPDLEFLLMWVVMWIVKTKIEVWKFSKCERYVECRASQKIVVLFSLARIDPSRYQFPFRLGDLGVSSTSDLVMAKQRRGRKIDKTTWEKSRLCFLISLEVAPVKRALSLQRKRTVWGTISQTMIYLDPNSRYYYWKKTRTILK